MSNVHTGFPARAGHLGLRRLSVSFGLGPLVPSPVRVGAGTPAAKSEVKAFEAVATVPEFATVSQVEIPTASSKVEQSEACSTVSIPTAETTSRIPTTGAEKDGGCGDGGV